MTGPKRLWSGDWMAESAAARARMADRRAAGETPDEDLAAAPAPDPARPGARERIAAAWASVAARLRALPRPAASGLRTRLILIAVLAGSVGAGAMVGVEA